MDISRQITVLPPAFPTHSNQNKPTGPFSVPQRPFKAIPVPVGHWPQSAQPPKTGRNPHFSLKNSHLGDKIQTLMPKTAFSGRSRAFCRPATTSCAKMQVQAGNLSHKSGRKPEGKRKNHKKNIFPLTSSHPFHNMNQSVIDVLEEVCSITVKVYAPSQERRSSYFLSPTERLLAIIDS